LGVRKRVGKGKKGGEKKQPTRNGVRKPLKTHKEISAGGSKNRGSKQQGRGDRGKGPDPGSEKRQTAQREKKAGEKKCLATWEKRGNKKRVTTRLSDLRIGP